MVRWPRPGWVYRWCVHKGGKQVDITTFGDLPYRVSLCLDCNGLRVFLASRWRR